MFCFKINNEIYVHEKEVVNCEAFDKFNGRGNKARWISRNDDSIGRCYYFYKNAKNEWDDTTKKNTKAKVFFPLKWCKSIMGEQIEENVDVKLEWELEDKDVESVSESIDSWAEVKDVKGRRYMLCKYLNLKTVVNLTDGYINATKLCNDYGEKKSYYRWKTTNGYRDAEKLLKNLSDKNKDSSDISDILFEYEETSKSKGHDIRGTYIHPKLVPQLAQWISPEFAMKVSEMIDRFTRRQREEEIKSKEEGYQREIKEKNELLREIKANHKEAMLKADETHKEAMLKADEALRKADETHKEAMIKADEALRKADETHKEAMLKADEALQKAELREQKAQVERDEAKQHRAFAEEKLTQIEAALKSADGRMDMQVITTILLSNKVDKMTEIIVNPPLNHKNREYIHIFEKTEDQNVFRLTKRQTISGKGKKTGETLVDSIPQTNAKQLTIKFFQKNYAGIERIINAKDKYLFRVTLPQEFSGFTVQQYIDYLMKDLLQSEKQTATKGRPCINDHRNGEDLQRREIYNQKSYATKVEVAI